MRDKQDFIVTRLNPMQSPKRPPTLATNDVRVIRSSRTMWVANESWTTIIYVDSNKKLDHLIVCYISHFRNKLIKLFENVDVKMSPWRRHWAKEDCLENIRITFEWPCAHPAKQVMIVMGKLYSLKSNCFSSPTVCFKDLDKLNLFKLLYDGFVLGFSELQQLP